MNAKTREAVTRVSEQAAWHEESGARMGNPSGRLIILRKAADMRHLIAIAEAAEALDEEAQTRLLQSSQQVPVPYSEAAQALHRLLNEERKYDAK